MQLEFYEVPELLSLSSYEEREQGSNDEPILEVKGTGFVKTGMNSCFFGNFTIAAEFLSRWKVRITLLRLDITARFVASFLPTHLELFGFLSETMLIILL